VEQFTAQRAGQWVYPLQKWTAPNPIVSPGVDQLFPFNDFDYATPRSHFDMSIKVTPGVFNQYLRERYLSNEFGLNGVWRPTYADLGIRAPRGTSPETSPPLTGTLLGRAVHRAFRPFGNRRFRIELRPHFMPFVSLPDLLGAPPTAGDAPIVYQLTNLQIDFISQAPNDPDPLKLRILAGFADPKLELEWATDTGTLDPTLSAGRAYHLTIVRSRLANCQLTPRVTPPRGTCEDDLTAAIAALLEPHLDSRLASMLDDFVVPTTFDVRGTTAPLDAQSTLTWVDGLHITFFANLIPR
jgi:hypothetical protein